MVLPDGTKEDADSIELRKNGRRVPDSFQLWQKNTFVFEYLGAEEGAAAAARDEAREKGEGEAELSVNGHWTLVNAGDKSKISFELKHVADSNKFRGTQPGVGALQECRIIKKQFIQWEIAGFKLRGRLEDDGTKMVEVTAKDGKGQTVAVYNGLRHPAAKCWKAYEKMDIKGRGDVETMPATDLDAVKRRVEVKGYSGFAVWKGHCYIKGGKPIVAEDLQYGGDEAQVTFHLYSKPDPFADAPVEEDEDDSAWLEEQAEQERKEREKRLAIERKEMQDPDKLARAEREKAEAQLTYVTVRHALKEMDSEVIVRVPKDSKISDLRRAVMEKCGETKLSEVRIVKKAGVSWTSMDVDQPIGDCRDFTSMGRKLTEAAVKKDTPSAVAAAQAEKLAPSKAPAGPTAAAGETVVKITHSTSGNSVEVAVPATASIMEVRKATAAKLGCQHTHVRIVKRMGKDGTGGWQSVLDSKKLDGQTELFCMGSALEKPVPGSTPPAAAPAAAKAPEPPKPTPAPTPPPAKEPEKKVFEDKELKISVYIDRAMNLEFPVTCKKGTTIKELKVMIAAADPTGGAKVEDLFLGMPFSTVPLPESTHVIEEHQSLDLIQKDQVTGSDKPEDSSPVEVTLTHAMDDTSCKITVPANSTIMEVRRAVMEKIGQTKLSEVKIVRKSASGIQTLADTDKLNGKTSLKTMGCPLSS
mmetsp:Transcript_72879/g.161239  ORF Transcript_72879/g.161239 Transcript_72879/m.161239 type:complete len:698 (-) Transcript_72879:41-2134(-)